MNIEMISRHSADPLLSMSGRGVLFGVGSAQDFIVVKLALFYYGVCWGCHDGSPVLRQHSACLERLRRWGGHGDTTRHVSVVGVVVMVLLSFQEYAEFQYRRRHRQRRRGDMSSLRSNTPDPDDPSDSTLGSYLGM